MIPIPINSQKHISLFDLQRNCVNFSYQGVRNTVSGVRCSTPFPGAQQRDPIQQQGFPVMLGAAYKQTQQIRVPLMESQSLA